MLPSDLTVEVRNRDMIRKGVVKAEDLTLEATPMFNAVGAWKLTLPAEHPLVPEMLTPGSGIIVTGPTDVIISGPTTAPSFAASTDDARGTITFEGVSDNIILADALAYPQPANADVTTQAVAENFRSDVPESLLHFFTRSNIGPTASSTRRNPHLIMGVNHLGGGLEIYKTAAFTPLLDLLVEIAGPANLGFRVVQRQNSLAFETYSVQDKSRSVRLTIDNNRLASQSVQIAAPAVTRAIVAGQGWASSRKYIETTSDLSLRAESEWGRRIERLVDSRDTNITSELQQAGIEALADGGFTSYTVTGVPTEDGDLSYGVDYNLGDSVSIEVRGAEQATVVAGVAVKADPDGCRIGLVMGDNDTATSGTTTGVTSTIPAALDGLTKRVALLERTTVATEDTNWITLPNNYTSGWGIQYMRRNGFCTIVLNGVITSVNNTVLNLSTSNMPTDCLPPTGLVVGGYFGGFPGTVSLGTAGNLTALQQTGANRGSVAATFTYPLAS